MSQGYNRFQNNTALHQ